MPRNQHVDHIKFSLGITWQQDAFLEKFVRAMKAKRSWPEASKATVIRVALGVFEGLDVDPQGVKSEAELLDRALARVQVKRPDKNNRAK